MHGKTLWLTPKSRIINLNEHVKIHKTIYLLSFQNILHIKGIITAKAGDYEIKRMPN